MAVAKDAPHPKCLELFPSFIFALNLTYPCPLNHTPCCPYPKTNPQTRTPNLTLALSQTYLCPYPKPKPLAVPQT